MEDSVDIESCLPLPGKRNGLLAAELEGGCYSGSGTRRV